jgi:hypothetical protein
MKIMNKNIAKSLLKIDVKALPVFKKIDLIKKIDNNGKILDKIIYKFKRDNYIPRKSKTSEEFIDSALDFMRAHHNSKEEEYKWKLKSIIDNTEGIKFYLEASFNNRNEVEDIKKCCYAYSKVLESMYYSRAHVDYGTYSRRQKCTCFFVIQIMGVTRLNTSRVSERLQETIKECYPEKLVLEINDSDSDDMEDDLIESKFRLPLEYYENKLSYCNVGCWQCSKPDVDQFFENDFYYTKKRKSRD